MDTAIKESIVLYTDKKQCCGCNACSDSCPKQAIIMKKDATGFVYPTIDEELCVRCGTCKSVCAYQNPPELKMPKATYAAAAKSDEIINASASGGVFAVLASDILQKGGYVYGAAMVRRQGKLVVEHIKVSDVEKLVLLQGSKYVQSDTNEIFKEVRRDLTEGCQVLFSGTPCQIAALRVYLKRSYDNLLTIDIICHGVPSLQLFQDYIEEEEKRRKRQIVDFKFRDKSKGQGMTSKLIYENNSTGLECKWLDGRAVSYMSLFLKSLTYRINCYTCPYAGPKRVADITLGDFWGVHNEHPEITKLTGMSDQKGISCVLVNTNKGEQFIESAAKGLLLFTSEVRKVARHNEQLVRPSVYNDERENIMKLYMQQGYAEVERYYCKCYMRERLIVGFKGIIPQDVKVSMKNIFRKFRRK